MIAIIDYGVGNLFSLKSSFSCIGEDIIVSGDKNIIRSADKIILPGVGAFGDAAEKLKRAGLDEVLKSEAKKGKPILGICLGMQLLFDKSLEYGEHRGLGLIHGNVVPMRGIIPDNLKIPHIGWNGLHFTDKKSDLLKYIDENDCVYFVHSFFASECNEAITSTTKYGCEITATVENRNIYGCQFHPEKSGSVGLKILKAFCETE